MDANPSAHQFCELVTESLPSSSRDNGAKNAILALLVKQPLLRQGRVKESHDNGELVSSTDHRCSVQLGYGSWTNDGSADSESDMETVAPLPLIQPDSSNDQSEDEDSSENDGPICLENPTTKKDPTTYLGSQGFSLMGGLGSSCQTSRSSSLGPLRRRQVVEHKLVSDIETTSDGSTTVTTAPYSLIEDSVKAGFKRSYAGHPPNKDKLLTLLRKGDITKKGNPDT
ncbi:hypothetical protein KEM54_002094 [Ascosphaera aggregata]|nr:hypothetical protein KEM54_002094 [Ascosphaera aggregata]